MIDPMLVILAPPAVIFGWAAIQMRRVSEEQPEQVGVKADA